MPYECLDLKSATFLAVSVRGKLEIKRRSKEVTASSRGRQQLIWSGRAGDPHTKCMNMISYPHPGSFVLFTFWIESPGPCQ